MRLFVSNFPFITTEEDLTELFSEFGSVTHVHIILDKETHRSRGFGFVELSTEAEGRAALEALHGFEYGGRGLKVDEARPREQRAAGGVR